VVHKRFNQTTYLLSSSPGAIAHAYFPSYFRDRDRQTKVQGQPGKKVSEALSQRTTWVWWHII
jgi:hypothetical protein